MNRKTLLFASIISAIAITGCSNTSYYKTHKTQSNTPKTIKFNGYSDGSPNTTTPKCISFTAGGTVGNVFTIKTGSYSGRGFPSPECQEALSILMYDEKYTQVNGQLIKFEDVFYYENIQEGYLHSVMSKEAEQFIIDEAIANDTITIGTQVIDTSDFEQFYNQTLSANSAREHKAKVLKDSSL